jgi:hypothetical protein
VAGPGGAREERCKEHIVQDQAVGVGVVQLEGAAVARLDRAAFGEQHGTLGIGRQQLAHRVGREHIDRSAAHRETGTQIEIAMHLRDVVAGHRGQPPVGRPHVLAVKAPEALQAEVF